VQQRGGDYYGTAVNRAARIGERILDLAESMDDDHLRVHGYLVLGANTGFQEGYPEGLEILDRGIALFERQQHSLLPFQLCNNPGIVCYTTSAFFLWWLGYPDRAVEWADRAIELATRLDHPFTLAYALFHTGSLHMCRGEMELANERAQATLAIAEGHGFQIWESLATILLGAAQMTLGGPEEGLAKVERGFVLYQGHKTPPVFFPHLIGMRALAYAQSGRPAEGLELLDGLIEEMGEKRLLRELPPVLLLKGELLLALSPENTAQAAAIFRAVLAGARHVGGKIVTLQAATSLCKLELQAGGAGESGQILAEFYNSFTEGFETAGLRNARAVLDECQGVIGTPS
jgi:tetratricopeptide (TPR) repeat protein